MFLSIAASKRRHACVACLMLAMSGLTGSSARADSPPSELTENLSSLMAGALTAADSANNIARQFGLGFYDSGHCMYAVYLKPGDAKSFDVRLVSGRQYVFLAGGDGNARDVDLRVFSARGQLLKQDSEIDNTPLVELVPRFSGTYTISMKLHAAHQAERGSFCTLVLLDDAGWKVPGDNIAQATRNYVRSVALAEVAARRNDARLRLRRESGSWCFTGCVMERRDISTLNGIRFPAGPQLVIAVGDSFASNIDLSVEGDGRAITDVEPHAIATTLVPAEAQTVYSIRVGLPAASGPSLVMTGVFELAAAEEERPQVTELSGGRVAQR